MPHYVLDDHEEGSSANACMEDTVTRSVTCNTALDLEAAAGVVPCSGGFFAFFPFGALLFSRRPPRAALSLSQRRVRLGAESCPRAKIHPPIAGLTASTDPIVGWSGRRRRWAVAIEPAASRARHRHRHRHSSAARSLAGPGCCGCRPVIFYHKIVSSVTGSSMRWI